MLKSREQYLKYALLVIVLVLGGILFYECRPFMSGALGACTVYMLVRKQMRRLVQKRGLKKSIAAGLILLESVLCILIPAFFAIWLLINKLTAVDLNMNALIASGHDFVNMVNQKTGYDILSADNISKVAASATDILQVLVSQISSFIVNSLVLLFILYFMLVGSEPMEKYLYDILPFGKRDKKEVVTEVNKMIKANAIGIPLLAAIQGIVAMIGYMIFGAPDPVLFGFLTCFATILPLIGTALIWFPLAAYLALTGHVGAGIGLAAYALIVISNVDNLVRFVLQERMASTHPLITVFGVIVGLSLFGFWGVIFGPLLFSMFFLCFDIYRREYIDKV
jgi:predicted PurR-regulated permease PerM